MMNFLLHLIDRKSHLAELSRNGIFLFACLEYRLARLCSFTGMSWKTARWTI